MLRFEPYDKMAEWAHMLAQVRKANLQLDGKWWYQKKRLWRKQEDPQVRSSAYSRAVTFYQPTSEDSCDDIKKERSIPTLNPRMVEVSGTVVMLDRRFREVMLPPPPGSGVSRGAKGSLS